jgi:hypothetical protein
MAGWGSPPYGILVNIYWRYIAVPVADMSGYQGPVAHASG